MYTLITRTHARAHARVARIYIYVRNIKIDKDCTHKSIVYLLILITLAVHVVLMKICGLKLYTQNIIIL